VDSIPVRMIRQDLDNLPRFPLPEGFSIRTWQGEDDIGVWVDIQNRADRLQPEDHTHFFHSAFGEDIPGLADRLFFLCDGKGEPIGTTTAWYGGSGHEGWGRIHWVAVAPEYQGRGLSKPLLAAAMTRLAESHTRAWLDTQTARPVAIRLYLNFGFVPEIANDEDRRAWRIVGETLDHPALRSLNPG